MFGVLLEKLSALLPKSFMISAFFPVLCFALLNGWLAYLTSATWQQWSLQYTELDAGKQALYGFPLLIALAFTAYVFSLFTGSMRQALEGAYLPGILRKRFASGQRLKFRKLEDKLNASRQRWLTLSRGENLWTPRLKAARIRGNAMAGTACTYSETHPAAITIERLLRRMERQERIDAEDIDDAVTQIEQELEKCSLRERPSPAPDEANKNLLARHQTDLSRSLRRYAVDFAETAFAEQYDLRDVYYSRYTMAPTTIGNIAQSVRSYARSRYHIKLDPFWSRLLKIVHDDPNFSAYLSDVNTRLDSVIALFWLTVVSTAFWLGYLLYLRRTIWLFLAIGLLGPLLAFVWYRIAVQSYLAFAQVMCTAIDLYRFKLLEALHVVLPNNSGEERVTWSGLNQVIGYGLDDDIKYLHQRQMK